MDIRRLEKVFDRTIGQLASLPLKESVQAGILADIAEWCGTTDVAEGFCRWVKDEYDEWEGPGWFRQRWEQYRATFLPDASTSKDNPNREWVSLPPPPGPDCPLCEDKGHSPEPEFSRCTCRMGQEVSEDYLLLVRESYKASLRKNPPKRDRARSSQPIPIDQEKLRRSNEQAEKAERERQAEYERKKSAEQREAEMEELRRQEAEALRVTRARREAESAARKKQELEEQSSEKPSDDVCAA